MPGPVTPRRHYNSTRRQAQAAQTRADIVRAAQAQFVEHGFAGTTLASIAERAGVVVETVYRSFDGKSGLFRAAVEDAVADGGTLAGSDPPDSETLRPHFAAILAATDPREQLRLYADLQPGIQERIGPLMRVLVEASSIDPAVQQVSEHLQAQRLHGMARMAHLLARQDALRDDLTVDEARDVLFALNSHPMYDLLVTRRGWTHDRYRDWLADTLIQLLLRPDAPKTANNDTEHTKNTSPGTR